MVINSREGERTVPIINRDNKNYGKKGGEKKKERERKEGSYFTRGRVTCLFRVVEQIYIALSPPVIPLSRCCCRTLDSVRRREIKREGGGERKGKRGEKKKMEGRKTRNIVS